MTHSRVLTLMIAIVFVITLVFLPAHGHDGHVKSAGATFDPNSPKQVSQATASAIDLKTAEVDFGQVEDVLRLSGIVRALPDSLVAISPIYPGVIRSITVQPGDRVTKGMVVGEFESPEVASLQFDLKRAESQVASLEIEVPSLVRSAEIAQAVAQRLSSTTGGSVAANVIAQRQSEALKIQSEAASRQIALLQARSDVDSLRRRVATTQSTADVGNGLIRDAVEGPNGRPLENAAIPGLIRFTSPIDGVVVSRLAILGQSVATGVAILTIGNFQSVQIDGELPEGLLNRLGSAQGAEVRVRTGSSATSAVVAQGTLRFISPTIDLAKRTAHVIVDVENASGALRPGQFVDLSVVLNRNESAVVVPASAIVKDGPLQFVFIVEGKDDSMVFIKRDIEAGVFDDRMVEIKQGLVPGDFVVTNGAFSLSQLRGFVPETPETSGSGKSAAESAQHKH
jgi:membrane fusion protein, heavy metal efflux system